ncbi:MAG TPA: HDOD domain-containing protein, partial [Armatimonadota bacterium]|nr:HDOD domain-containing protein [Armatimonadota bacterium]
MAGQGGEGSQSRVLPDRVRQVLSRVQDMPTVSTVLADVAEATSDPEVSARAVAEIIARDQALTMRLLRIV